MVATSGSGHFQVLPLSIPDVKSIVAPRHADARGFISETFNRRDLAAAGIDFDGVQDNRSVSLRKGTVRGLHFQAPPFAQAKLVRVSRGAIFDVAVDLRRGSPTYGRHVSLMLNAADGGQMFVPNGFAHGFCTLEPDTEVLYKVDNYYSKQHEAGIRWNDPALAIHWPVSTGEAVVSERDRAQPLLKDIAAVFALEDRAKAGAR
ncbi:MAG TPA: dTDP-4-dehydrorhamnose 3,5-epimerase [Xanthobacteraceae bacterium]